MMMVGEKNKVAVVFSGPFVGFYRGTGLEQAFPKRKQKCRPLMISLLVYNYCRGGGEVLITYGYRTNYINDKI